MAVVFNKKNLDQVVHQCWTLFEPFIQYLERSDKEFVELAFDYMVQRHGDQRRKSGDFYIIHPVLATITLAKLNMDRQTLCASLLHDVPEDTFTNPEDGIKEIQLEFGSEVAFLVSGITKLGLIKYRGDSAKAENLRSMFVAMSKDLRVIFIKLADRIHNLRTLNFLPEQKAQRIALESIEIYAPIAERLGMFSFRSKIEDLGFPYAYPEQYKKLHFEPRLVIQKRQKQVKKLTRIIKNVLDKEKIQYIEVKGRAKRLFSINEKIQVKNKKLKQIYDILALRVITKNVGDCYKVLSFVNQYFEPLEGRVKDYISKPKSNGYQSLHTTVRDQLGTIFEVQIRTKQMHQFAEYGVASHWSYKDRNANQVTLKKELLDKESFRWIQKLVDLGKVEMTDKDYLKQVRLNLFSNRIYVLTPMGDVVDLPKDSTCLDFAYRIHEFIGGHARIAKVNDKVVKLNQKLKTGDRVEIITHKNQRPNQDWLNWVKTGQAAKRIRSFLRTIGIDLSKDKKK